MKALILSAAGLFLSAASLFAQEGVVVNGTGRVAVVPDAARVTLSVQTEGQSAEEVNRKNASSCAKLFAWLKDQKVDSKDIQSSGLGLHAERDEKRRVVRYFGQHRIVVVVRDLKEVGVILDGSVQAGANQVSGVSFFLKNPEAHLTKARQAAVADARGKAETLATAAGVKLGRLRSLSESSGDRYHLESGYADLQKARTSGTQVEPGTQDVTVSVHLVYDVQE